MGEYKADQDLQDVDSVTSSNYDKYLRLATDKNPSILLELDLQCNVRHVSKVWNSVIGTNRLQILGNSISNYIIGNDSDKMVFHRALTMMMVDDNSYRVKFMVETGDLIEASKSSSSPTSISDSSSDDASLSSIEKRQQLSLDDDWHGNNQTIELEAQGILIHDVQTQTPSHTMWIIKPFYEIDELDNLPHELVKKLGFGAKILSHYLQQIEDMMILDEMDLPTPNFELCRVCETMIPTWWLETHSQICVCEHRIESVVELVHDDLLEQNRIIDEIIASLEEGSGDDIPEYKGLPVPLPSLRSRSPSPQNLTPLLSERPSQQTNHQCSTGLASRSVRKNTGLLQNQRFPLKTLYALQNLCEEAIEINPSELKFQAEMSEYDNNILHPNPVFYQFSPGSESHMEHVLKWNLNLEVFDASINMLVEDTVSLCKQKAESILRMDNTMKYSLKVKSEVDQLISQLIKERIESNRINVSYTLGLNPSTDTLSSMNQMQTDDIPIGSEIVTPLPQRLSNRGSNLFSESYMRTDTIPESHSMSSNSLKHLLSEANYTNSSGNSPKISKSITPKQLVEEGSPIPALMEPVSGELNLQPSICHKSNPSTPKFGGSNFLNLPKLSTSISLTPRRGSPINFNTPGSSSNSKGQQSSIHNAITGSGGSTAFNILNNFSGSKSVAEGSPMLYPHLGSSEGLVSIDSQQKNQPLSPLLLPTTGKPIAPSIRDYEVIKPISKGAYGSVFLAKKRVTGEYFAIKVLKKSDMIAKNQVTNVKSERAIMMVQSDKPYVAKLYATFQNKENLFLVMEYLSGGDIATLIKMMGSLPDRWAKQYICEVIVGVHDMHQNGIIHHDLKPDNLLIDSHGHIKLTDFGLSRMGLLRRHKHKRQEVQSSSSRKTSFPTTEHAFRKDSGSESVPSVGGAANLFDLVKKGERSHSTSSTHSQSGLTDVPFLTRTGSHVSFSMSDISRAGTPPLSSSSVSGMDHLTYQHPNAHHTRVNSNVSDKNEHFNSIESSRDLALFHPNGSKNFFGTPDYLAPETIKGTGESPACDWWSVGCIFFEFLYGYPPFHAVTVEEVFDNILNGNINWPPSPESDSEVDDVDPQAKDLVKKFLNLKPEERLGAQSIEQIKRHPYFAGIDWDRVYDEEASFIPQVENPEDTDYFELRGASLNEFISSNYGEEKAETTFDTPASLKSIDMQLQRRLSSNGSGTNTPKQRLSIGSVLEMVNNDSSSATSSPTNKHLPLAIPPHMRERRGSKLNDNSAEFGSFNYRNLNALDKANKDAITRLKSEHMSEYSHQRTSSSSISSSSSDASNKVKQTVTHSPQGPVQTAMMPRRSNSPQILKWNTSSPTRRNSVDALSPRLSGNRVSEVAMSLMEEFSNTSSTNSSPLASKFKSPLSPPSGSLNPTLLGRPRKFSRNSFSSGTEEDERMTALSKINNARKSRRRSRKSSSTSNEFRYKLDILLCEPIPIHRYRISSDLESLGCSVVSVGAGDEMVRRATTGVKFDLIMTAMKLSKIGAVDIAKLIRHTNSANCDTPIVALAAYYEDAKAAKVFDEILEKPVGLAQLRELVSRYALMKSQTEEDTLLSDIDI